MDTDDGMMDAEPTIRLRWRLFVLEIADSVTGEMTKVCGCVAVTGSEGATELMMVTVAGVEAVPVLWAMGLAAVAGWASHEKLLPEVRS